MVRDGLTKFKVLSNDVDVYDVFSVIKVSASQTEPIVVLSNEQHTFVGDAEGKIPKATVRTDILYYKGGVKQPIFRGDVVVSNLPSGMRATVVNDGDDAYVVLDIEEGATFGTNKGVSGEVDIRVTYPTEQLLHFGYTKIIASTQGQDGKQGDPGVGVENVVSYYALSNSQTMSPTDMMSSAFLGEFLLGGGKLGIGYTSWTTTPQSLSRELPFLWTYDVYEYSDGTTKKMPEHVIGVGGKDAVNLLLYTPNGNVFEAGGETKLEIRATGYLGATPIVDAKYSWERKNYTGEYERLSDITPSIIVDRADVSSTATYRCTMVYEDEAYYATITIIDKTDTVVTSDTPPENVEVGMLWLDTSREDKTIDTLKRCIGFDEGTGNPIWKEVTISSDTVSFFTDKLTEHEASLEVLNDKIESFVSRTEYDEDMKTYSETLISQTADKITLEVGRLESTVNGRLTNTESTTANVKSYFDFTSDGLYIGKKDMITQGEDPFRLHLTNRKLAFMEGYNEVAYMSDQALYITDARITDTLSVGTEENGWFDWVTLGNGMAIKWRSDPNKT